LVEHVRDYLLGHVKGITQAVPDSEIPREFFHEFCEARDEIQSEHIEEDLEAERVNSLYVMNHYLSVSSPKNSTPSWWRPQKAEGSPLIDHLVRQYWDQGPLAQIDRWIAENSEAPDTVVELGCGVGGLCKRLAPRVKKMYLGVDSSFASIAIARHLALGMPYAGRIRIPEDLLQGPVSRDVKIEIPAPFQSHSDFIVGDLDFFPIEKGKWDLAISLNTIDMLDDPASLPQLQHHLLKKNGLAIQSCPYIWHPEVARRLRKKLPAATRDVSSVAIQWLYEQSGFKIEQSANEIPWLFFKHIRQMEIYSVHAFVARKCG
jgi:SAM-dependent methyltransferase